MMKESYEALEMEVIALDGEVFTGDVVSVSGDTTVTEPAVVN